MRPCFDAVKFYGFVRFLPTPNGGDEEDRTPDPLRARQVLSQLSYTPIFSSLAVLLSFWAYTPICVRGRTVIFFSSFVKLLSIFRCCEAPSKLNNRRRFNATQCLVFVVLFEKPFGDFYLSGFSIERR